MNLNVREIRTVCEILAALGYKKQTNIPVTLTAPEFSAPDQINPFPQPATSTPHDTLTMERRMGTMVNAARIGKMINAYKILVGMPEGNESLGRLKDSVQSSSLDR